jgi:hypothetical protein
MLKRALGYHGHVPEHEKFPLTTKPGDNEYIRATKFSSFGKSVVEVSIQRFFSFLTFAYNREVNGAQWLRLLLLL